MIRRLTTLFHKRQPGAWDLSQFQRILEDQITAAVARGVEAPEIESVTMSLLAEPVEMAAVLLAELKRTAPRMIREHRRLGSGFRNRSYRRWKEGFDLLKMMLVASQEVGSAYNEYYRPSPVENQDPRFEALINLHARALRVSEEIYSLLLAGYPDGALSRWRTLHEIAVIMTFLRESDPSISERFILYRRVAAYHAIKEYRAHQDRANLTPVTDEEFEELEEAKDAIVKEYGPEMESRNNYGWAVPALEVKRPNLYHIEKFLGLDHWRPRFRWACDDIHGNYKPFGTSLGTSESKEEVLLVGASNSGFTDPAHMLAISLNLANHALFTANLSLDLSIMLHAFRTLSDEIGEAFFLIDRETSPDSARSIGPTKNSQR